MQEKDKLNKRKRALEKILTSPLERNDMSEKTSDMISRLFIDSENDPVFQEVIEELFDNDAELNTTPDKETFESLARARERLGLQELAPEAEKAPAPKISLRRRTLLRVASVAAAVIFIAGSALVLTNRSNVTPDGTGATIIADGTPTAGVEKDKGKQATGLSEMNVRVETVEGVQKDIVLHDNSKVWVNAETKIAFPETFEEQREVHLACGEAYFAVERDEEKPFTVHTEKLHIRVLGTKFNVVEDLNNGITEVILYEGSVEVAVDERTETLVPDEKLTYYHETGELTVETIVKAAPADWRQERIMVDMQTIPQLLRKVANYYDMSVVYEGSQDSTALASGELYTIIFDKSYAAEKVLSILSEVCYGLEYEINNDTIVIK